MKKTIQYFTKEYLERCKNLTPEQIIEFLENYRTLIEETSKKNIDTSSKNKNKIV